MSQPRPRTVGLVLSLGLGLEVGGLIIKQVQRSSTTASHTASHAAQKAAQVRGVDEGSKHFLVTVAEKSPASAGGATAGAGVEVVGGAKNNGEEQISEEASGAEEVDVPDTDEGAYEWMFMGGTPKKCSDVFAALSAEEQKTPCWGGDAGTVVFLDRNERNDTDHDLRWCTAVPKNGGKDACRANEPPSFGTAVHHDVRWCTAVPKNGGPDACRAVPGAIANEGIPEPKGNKVWPEWGMKNADGKDALQAAKKKKRKAKEEKHKEAEGRRARHEAEKLQMEQDEQVPKGGGNDGATLPSAAATVPGSVQPPGAVVTPSESPGVIPSEEDEKDSSFLQEEGDEDDIPFCSD
eukprot:g18261.t1